MYNSHYPYEEQYYDFSDVTTIAELDNLYANELDFLINGIDERIDNYRDVEYGLVGELPYELRQIAKNLEKLGNAYESQLRWLESSEWVYLETPITTVIEVAEYPEYGFSEAVGKVGTNEVVYRKYNDGTVEEVI